MSLVQMSPAVHVNDSFEDKRDDCDQDDVENNIPYHARENARPFTYGSLPEGFSQSDLSHVVVEEVLETPNVKRVHNIMQQSPTVLRKSSRPSISPSRPVLRKTPSRKEFEEMLMERREQSFREQNNDAIKIAQNAAIQKDLDQLQAKLNKSVLFAEKETAAEFKVLPDKNKAVVKTVESIDLPNATLRKFDSGLNLDSSRSETPSFPHTVKSDRCTSPYTAVSLNSPKLSRSVEFKESTSQNDLANVPLLGSVFNETHEVEPHLVKFAKDSSEYWYKPHITREEAVALLRNASPGTFLIRCSTTYKNSYGLVLRVAKAPLGAVVTSSPGDELVRHFLLEPTTRGVRLKGCTIEPIFTSLSAFVYQHSINQLALPCKLNIPDCVLLLSTNDVQLLNKQKHILSQGAACNLLYLFTCDTESLTGEEAVRKTVSEMFSMAKLLTPVGIHFKVSNQGITLTDNTRKVFFRRHYSSQNISHFGLDPDGRLWRVIAIDEGLERVVNKSIFAFVARLRAGSKDNQCHVFCDLAVSQPALAIVSFANKVLPFDRSNHSML